MQQKDNNVYVLQHAVTAIPTSSTRRLASGLLASSLLAALFVTTSFFSSPAQAATYRWVDANGVVNYSQRKPRNVPEDQITTVGNTGTSAIVSSDADSTPAPASSTPPANDDLTDEQQVMLKRLQEAEAQRQAAVREIKQDNCQKSRRALEDLTAKERIRINLDDGSQRILGEDERQEFIAQAQQGIVRNCDNS